MEIALDDAPLTHPQHAPNSQQDAAAAKVTPEAETPQVSHDLNGILPAAVHSVEKIMNGLQHEVVPERFLCPLTKQVMEEPVVIESGLVFDKSSIKEHLAANDATCPITHTKVNPDVVIPVAPLKKEIQSWKSSKHLNSDALSTVSGHSMQSEALSEVVSELATITRALSQHLESAKSLSRSLSALPSRRGFDAESLDGVEGDKPDLVRQVSRASAAAGHQTQQLLGALFGHVVALVKLTSEVVGSAASHAVPASHAVAHHVVCAAQHVKWRAGKAVNAVGDGIVEVYHVVKTSTGPVVVATYENIGPALTSFRGTVGSATLCTRDAVIGAAIAAQTRVGAFSANFPLHVACARDGAGYHASRAFHGTASFVAPKAEVVARHVAGAVHSAQEAAGPVVAAAQHHLRSASRVVGENAAPVIASAQHHVSTAAAVGCHHAGEAARGLQHSVHGFASPALALLGRRWSELPLEARRVAVPVAVLIGLKLIGLNVLRAVTKRGPKAAAETAERKQPEAKSAEKPSAAGASSSKPEFDLVKALLQISSSLHLEAFLHHLQALLSGAQHKVQHELVPQVQSLASGAGQKVSEDVVPAVQSLVSSAHHNVEEVVPHVKAGVSHMLHQAQALHASLTNQDAAQKRLSRLDQKRMLG